MTTPVPEPDSGNIRASDADRQRIARVVHHAVGEGRLTLAEADDRLAAVYRATTVGELAPLVADLPGHGEVVAALGQSAATSAVGWAAAVDRVGGRATSRHAVGIMSGAVRKGPWVVPTLFHATALMGGVELDLTDAHFETPTVEIRVFALMGGVEIIVPDTVAVDVRGFAFMGGFDHPAPAAAPAGAPQVRVTGLAFMGGVEVLRPGGRRRWRK